MSRPLRIEFPGAVYHVTSRGNAKQKIFEDDKDRELFLSLIGHVVERYGWLCHAYCLMNNHYHLLIETPLPNLSRGMRQLNGLYTQRYNKRHTRVGHLFQGRFKSVLVEKEAHLLELCRYIDLNPLRAKIVDHPFKWQWSSYGATVGRVPRPLFLTTDWILRQFGDRLHDARQHYQVYVSVYEDTQNPWEKLSGQIYLGTDLFVETHQPDRLIPEVPRRHSMAKRPTLNELLDDKQDINQAILEAYKRYGYRLTEIANHLNVYYTTISRRLKRAENTDA